MHNNIRVAQENSDDDEIKVIAATYVQAANMEVFRVKPVGD